MKIRVTSALAIDNKDLEYRFIRATGPGGQNVNKVATAVQLRFDALRLPADIRLRTLRLAGRRATAAGVIVIEAKRYRSQERNREDALARLIALIRRAAEPPASRKTTRVPPAERRQRVEVKRRRGKRKRLRKPPVEE